MAIFNNDGTVAEFASGQAGSGLGGTDSSQVPGGVAVTSGGQSTTKAINSGTLSKATLQALGQNQNLTDAQRRAAQNNANNGFFPGGANDPNRRTTFPTSPEIPAVEQQITQQFQQELRDSANFVQSQIDAPSTTAAQRRQLEDLRRQIQQQQDSNNQAIQQQQQQIAQQQKILEDARRAAEQRAAQDRIRAAEQARDLVTNLESGGLQFSASERKTIDTLLGGAQGGKPLTNTQQQQLSKAIGAASTRFAQNTLGDARLQAEQARTDLQATQGVQADVNQSFAEAQAEQERFLQSQADVLQVARDKLFDSIRNGVGGELDERGTPNEVNTLLQRIQDDGTLPPGFDFDGWVEDFLKRPPGNIIQPFSGGLLPPGDDQGGGILQLPPGGPAQSEIIDQFGNRVQGIFGGQTFSEGDIIPSDDFLGTRDRPFNPAIPAAPPSPLNNNLELGQPISFGQGPDVGFSGSLVGQGQGLVSFDQGDTGQGGTIQSPVPPSPVGRGVPATGAQEPVSPAGGVQSTTPAGTTSPGRPNDVNESFLSDLLAHRDNAPGTGISLGSALAPTSPVGRGDAFGTGIELINRNAPLPSGLTGVKNLIGGEPFGVGNAIAGIGSVISGVPGFLPAARTIGNFLEKITPGGVGPLGDATLSIGQNLGTPALTTAPGAARTLGDPFERGLVGSSSPVINTVGGEVARAGAAAQQLTPPGGEFGRPGNENTGGFNDLGGDNVGFISNLFDGGGGNSTTTVVNQPIQNERSPQELALIQAQIDQINTQNDLLRSQASSQQDIGSLLGPLFQQQSAAVEQQLAFARQQQAQQQPLFDQTLQLLRGQAERQAFEFQATQAAFAQQSAFLNEQLAQARQLDPFIQAELQAAQDARAQQSEINDLLIAQFEQGTRATPDQLEQIDAQISAAQQTGESDINEFGRETIQRIRNELAGSLGLRPTDAPILDRADEVAEETVRQQGQLTSGLAEARASAALNYPLAQRNVLGQQELALLGLNQAAAEFGAGLQQAGFNNRLRLADTANNLFAGVRGGTGALGGGIDLLGSLGQSNVLGLGSSQNLLNSVLQSAFQPLGFGGSGASNLLGAIQQPLGSISTTTGPSGGGGGLSNALGLALGLGSLFG